MGNEMSIGDEAEQFLASLAKAENGPEPHECLRCFLRRAVSRRGCDGGFGSVRRWQLANPGAPPDLIHQLEIQGGGCDCEVVLNVFRDEIVPPPRPLPSAPPCIRAPAPLQARIGWRPAHQGSCPELTVEAILGFVECALVGARRQVLPASVAYEERDVGAFLRLDCLPRLAERGMHDGPVEIPAKIPSGRSVRGSGRGLARAHREAGRQTPTRRRAPGRTLRRGFAGRRPVRRSVARPRRCGMAGTFSAKIAPNAHQRPGRPQTGDEVGDRREIFQDLRSRGRIVRRVFAGLPYWSSMTQPGFSAAICLAIRTASFEPPAAGDETTSAPHIVNTCRRSAEVFSGMTHTRRYPLSRGGHRQRDTGVA